MSKKFNRHNEYDGFDDESAYRSDYYEELKAHRKNKRIRNALRSRNVDDLIRDLDDDYDAY